METELQSISLFDFISNYDTKAKCLKRFGYIMQVIDDNEEELKASLKNQIGDNSYNFINDFMIKIAKKSNWSLKDTPPYLKEVIANPFAYSKDLLEKWEDFKEFFQWYDNIYQADKQKEYYNTLIYTNTASVDGVRNDIINKTLIFIAKQLSVVTLEAGKHYNIEPIS